MPEVDDAQVAREYAKRLESAVEEATATAYEIEDEQSTGDFYAEAFECEARAILDAAFRRAQVPQLIRERIAAAASSAPVEDGGADERLAQAERSVDTLRAQLTVLATYADAVLLQERERSGVDGWDDEDDRTTLDALARRVTDTMGLGDSDALWRAALHAAVVAIAPAIDNEALRTAPPEWKTAVGAAYGASPSPGMTLGEADAMLRAALPHLAPASPVEGDARDGDRALQRRLVELLGGIFDAGVSAGIDSVASGAEIVRPNEARRQGVKALIAMVRAVPAPADGDARERGDLTLTDGDGDTLKLTACDDGRVIAKTVHGGRPDATRVVLSADLQARAARYFASAPSVSVETDDGEALEWRARRVDQFDGVAAPTETIARQVARGMLVGRRARPVAIENRPTPARWAGVDVLHPPASDDGETGAGR